MKPGRATSLIVVLALAGVVVSEMGCGLTAPRDPVATLDNADVLGIIDESAIREAEKLVTATDDHDFSWFYDIFEKFQGDLAGTLAVIDMPWADERVLINIAAYMNRADDAFVNRVCGKFNRTFCARWDVPGCEENLPDYRKECPLGGLGRLRY